MAYKRLIAMVPVRGGQVVLSYGYAHHRPAGRLRSVLKNLDRWGVDEIAVVDISHGLDQPDWRLLDEIRESAVRTPVAFGGGIRRAEHAVKAIALGCDRVIVETLLWTAPQEIAAISLAVGQQAVIGATPLVLVNSSLHAQAARGGPPMPWARFEERIAQASISERGDAAKRHALWRAGLDDCVGLARRVLAALVDKYADVGIEPLSSDLAVRAQRIKIECSALAGHNVLVGMVPRILR